MACSCKTNGIGSLIPSNFGSPYCAKCCNTSPAPACEAQCSKKTMEFVATCSEESLIEDGCTLITEIDVPQERRSYKILDIITLSYNRAGDTRGCNLEVATRYLDIYNTLAIQVTDELEGVRRPKTALVKTCGYCEFIKPPDLKEIISVSNDIKGCNSGCKTRRYTYIPVTQFIGSKLINGYTIRGNSIYIKSPAECGCSGEGIPNLLMLDYYAGVPRAITVEDEIELNEEQFLAIHYLLAIEFAYKLGKENIATRYEKLYEKFSERHQDYDQQQTADPAVIGYGGLSINWHQQ